jgi:hypothetical protein
LGDFVALHNYWKNLFAGASSSQHCDKVGGGAPVFFSQRERETETERETERDRDRRDGGGGGKERKGRICAFCVKIETGIRIVRKWWYRRRVEQGTKLFSFVREIIIVGKRKEEGVGI